MVRWVVLAAADRSALAPLLALVAAPFITARLLAVVVALFTAARTEAHTVARMEARMEAHVVAHTEVVTAAEVDTDNLSC